MQRKRIWKPIQFEPGDTRLVDMNQDYKNGEKTSHNTTSICGHLVSEDSQDLLAKLRFPDANKQMTN